MPAPMVRSSVQSPLAAIPDKEASRDTFQPLRRPIMQRSSTSTSMASGGRRPSLDADPFANAKRAHEANLILRHGLSPKAASYLSGDRPPVTSSQRTPIPPTSPRLGDFMMETEEDFDYFSAAIASNASSESSGSCLPTPDEPSSQIAIRSPSSERAFSSFGSRLPFDLSGLTLAASPMSPGPSNRKSGKLPSSAVREADQGQERSAGHRRSMSSSSKSSSRRGTSPQKNRERNRKAALLLAAKEEEAFGDFSDMEDYLTK